MWGFTWQYFRSRSLLGEVVEVTCWHKTSSEPRGSGRIRYVDILSDNTKGYSWSHPIIRIVIKVTLPGTNISPEKSILKMIFLFPRWDMLISWRVSLVPWGFRGFFFGASNSSIATGTLHRKARWVYRAMYVVLVSGAPKNSCWGFPLWGWGLLVPQKYTLKLTARP